MTRFPSTPALLGLATLLLSGCLGGKSSPPATRVASPATTVPRLGPGQVLHHIGATFEYGGFMVTIGNSVYDSSQKKLAVAVRYTNIGGQWHDSIPQAELRDAGTVSPLITEPVTVPPGQTAEKTVTFPTLSRDPSATGKLVWGRPDRTVTSVRLADGKLLAGWAPTAVKVDGWARIGKYGVHVTGGRLLSGFLDLDVEADPTMRVLRLDFDEWAAAQDPVNGFYPVEHLSLQRPDGTVTQTDQSSDGIAPVSWTASAGHWIEFPVAAKSAGRYQLLLTSLSTKGFSTFHSELLERAAFTFTLSEVKATSSPLVDAPEPDLAVFASIPTSQSSKAVDVTLHGSAVNVPGFLFQPSRLTWDPVAKTADLAGTATVLERDDTGPADPSTPAGVAAGLLDTPPQFSFSALLVSRGHWYTGIISGPTQVERGKPARVTIRFLSVDAFDPRDLGLAIGSPHGAASTVPLTKGSALGLYPPLPLESKVNAPTVTAGPWSITVRSYRLGRLQTTLPPPPGRTELELTMDVTIATNAQPKALGLSFRPSVQVFLSRPDGYLQQAVGDGGFVAFQPGETHRQNVVFHVPDSFRPGPLGVVLRGGDETVDVTTDIFPETTFTAVLAGGLGGGL